MVSNQAALVLLSGGIDSATTLAIARSRSDQVYAITFDYGQRHRCELESARAVARSIGVERHLLFPVDLRPIGGSALTDNIAVPKNVERKTENTEIPITYVPARNTIFLSIALAWAETLGVKSILIGANAVDYSGYPDCRPEFIRAFEQLANLATRIGVEGHDLKIEAPLMNLHKAEIIQKGTALGVDYSQTISCYDPTPDGLSCGSCDSCRIRRQGFLDAGIMDPTRYR